VASLLKFTEKLVGDLLAIIKDEKKSDGERAAAAGQAIDFRRSDTALAKTVLELINAQTDADFAGKILDVLGRSEAPLAKEILAASSGWSPSIRTSGLEAFGPAPRLDPGFPRSL
jgi:hypothetical protein